MNSVKLIFAFSIFMVLNLSAQTATPVLPGQLVAMNQICVAKGVSQSDLNRYSQESFGKMPSLLSQQEAAEMIVFLQQNSSTAIRRAMETKTAPGITQIRTGQEPILATILEVGMTKRFHLTDGNIIFGTITKVDDTECHIKTDDGVLIIPKTDILEETVHITKKDDTRYVGPVLSESPEDINIRTKYGDITVNKKDVKDIDRFHGGVMSPMTEEKKTFYQGEAVLTDIFTDATAFPLAANTFYVSGLSIGYGFTDRIMIRTSFGSDFSGDLNVHPFYQLLHEQKGGKESALGIGFKLFNRHPDRTIAGMYSQFIVNKTSGQSLNEAPADLNDVLSDYESREVFGEIYCVYSRRFAMESGRGKAGYHLGVKTNTLMLHQPGLKSEYKYDNQIYYPLRVYSAFDYDLSKNLKLTGSIWYDNGNRAKTLSQSLEDYFDDFTMNDPGGDYRPVDFDFGFIYAVNKTFRLGIHFQQPFFVIYWEMYEL